MLTFLGQRSGYDVKFLVVKEMEDKTFRGSQYQSLSYLILLLKLYYLVISFILLYKMGYNSNKICIYFIKNCELIPVPNEFHNKFYSLLN